MRTIYVGFSSPHKFKIGAFFISLWMNRKYSHVYLRFDSKNGIPSNVYHAAHGMVHFREFGNFKLENKIIKEFEIQLSEDDRKDVLIECIKIAGENYSLRELPRIVLNDIMNSLGIRTNIGNTNGYVCSELVGKLLVDKLKLKFDKPTYLLKPNDIDKKLTESGYKSI